MTEQGLIDQIRVQTYWLCNYEQGDLLTRHQRMEKLYILEQHLSDRFGWNWAAIEELEINFMKEC